MYLIFVTVFIGGIAKMNNNIPVFDLDTCWTFNLANRTLGFLYLEREVFRLSHLKPFTSQLSCSKNYDHN